jgi:hypothetical protein
VIACVAVELHAALVTVEAPGAEQVRPSVLSAFLGDGAERHIDLGEDAMHQAEEVATNLACSLRAGGVQGEVEKVARNLVVAHRLTGETEPDRRQMEQVFVTP